MHQPFNAIFFCIFLVTAFSCKKEAPKKEEPVVKISFYEKHSVPFDTMEITNNAPNCNASYSYLESYRFLQPKVNPLNPYEFCFLRVRNQAQTEEDCDLFVYNFENNHIKPIANRVRHGADWSVKDWIIFTKAGENSEIWKVKSNGDSLTQLINENSPEKPKWSRDGKHFVFYCRGCTVMKISDADGHVIKSLSIAMSAWEWLSNNEILYYNSAVTDLDLFAYNFQNDSVRKVASIENKNSSWSYNWQQGVLLHAGKEFAKLNLSNASKKIIKPFFFLGMHSADDYNSAPNFSNDKIISQRNSTVKLINENCKYSLRSDISVMNADGSNERRVVIPEY